MYRKSRIDSAIEINLVPAIIAGVVIYMIYHLVASGTIAGLSMLGR
ncbi:MAG: hypothetical protein KGL39_14090 [Patescibacteria group bacterium]|nr:hypothetical protein [Patescibacteria group bacterium]